MAKISLTPGRTVSAGSIVGLIFLLFFIIIVAWIGTVLFMLVYHIKNLNRPKGLSLIDINTEPENNNELKRSPMQSLRELELLKKDALINETEYQKKRTQILDERW